MSNKTEGTINGLAAILVIFTEMWDPRISVVLAVIALLGIAVYKFRRKGE